MTWKFYLKKGDFFFFNIYICFIFLVFLVQPKRSSTTDYEHVSYAAEQHYPLC